MIQPYYDHDGVTIYHGDCVEIAADLWVFDLMLTDPPYGLGKRMSGGTWGREEHYGDMWRWDVAPDASVILSLAQKARRSIVWGGNYFGLPASRCWLSWSKTNAVQTMAGVELAWTNFDKPAKEWRGPVGVHDTGHPTQKPLPLIQWCLSVAGPDVRTVFDPYAGSGTTGLAAKNAGLSAVLVEREERYCEIAAKRLSQGVLPMGQTA